MKKLKTAVRSITLGPGARKLNVYLAATATVAALALTTSAWVGRAHGQQAPGNATPEGSLNQLVAAFHLAASYGGDVEGMMALWADDSSLTFNGTPYLGKDGVRDWVTHHSAPFQHYWVSLAPEYKTQFDFQGNTASVYLECHFADPAVTPYVIRADVKVVGTVKLVNGTWLIDHLDFTTGTPL